MPVCRRPKAGSDGTLNSSARMNEYFDFSNCISCSRNPSLGSTICRLDFTNVSAYSRWFHPGRTDSSDKLNLFIRYIMTIADDREIPIAQ